MSCEAAPYLVCDIVPFRAACSPDAIALVDGERAWTYGQLNGTVRRTAAWLADSGVRPGDRVMLVGENCCAAVAVFLAANLMGAWPVVVNARLSDREIDEICEHSGARRIVFTIAASLRARNHHQRYGGATAEPADFGPVGVGPLNETARPEPMESDRANAVAALIYTSGTTGRPKGVMLSHRNLMFVARASGEARRLAPADRVLAVLPVSHILGLTGVLLGSLVSGAQVHLASRFDPGALFSALERERLTVLIGTPSMYAMLAEYASRKGMARVVAPALRLVSAAGPPLDAATKHTTEVLFGQTLHNGYGITECSPTVTLTPLNLPRTDCGVGRPLEGVETRLVDSSGADADAEGIGELWVRSPGIMKGYYRAPEETAATVDGEGWFKTGDLARSRDGSFFIVGRSKEMIIRFGFNVYPAEIEGVLNGHPGVARSAIVGHEVDGREEIAAFVQPVSGSGVTDAELAAYAAARLAPYKRPSKFIMLEAMPLSPGGKILKAALAASLQIGVTRQRASIPA